MIILSEISAAGSDPAGPSGDPRADAPDGPGKPRSVGLQEGWTLAGAFAAVYAVLAVSRYVNFTTMSWDLGIFQQVVRSYAELRAPVSDLKGPGFDILGDHFSPVVALLAPLYRLLPGPVTLLLAQSALFGLSVLPVTRAGVRRLGRAAGLSLGVAYGLSWGLQKAADFDFHEICFAVALIAFALEAVLDGRWRTALAWCTPLVLVKEDLGLTAAVIAALVAYRSHAGDPRTSRIAVVLAAVTAAASVLTVAWLIPAFDTHGYDYWSKLDASSSLPLLGGDLAEKLRTLLWTLVPTTGLLALRSPLLAVAVPTLGWRFASSDEHYWSNEWHYSAVIMPVTALALLDALVRTRTAGRPWLRAYAHRLPACVLSAALALSTTLPVARLIDPASYRVSAPARDLERALARIPSGSTVEADVQPSAHLTDRCRVFWIGDTQGRTPDYIVYRNDTGSESDALAYAHELHPDASYELVDRKAGHWILGHVAAPRRAVP
ncbi:DUF2079 domain-containing protein [Streptomyces griseofuscus]|uniref:DUF2079 domain-containing protein n=1 Tax=Streptomyces griseofuscus TaxID=146922 RepID=UPI003696337F